LVVGFFGLKYGDLIPIKTRRVVGLGSCYLPATTIKGWIDEVSQAICEISKGAPRQHNLTVTVRYHTQPPQLPQTSYQGRNGKKELVAGSKGQRRNDSNAEDDSVAKGRISIPEEITGQACNEEAVRPEPAGRFCLYILAFRSPRSREEARVQLHYTQSPNALLCLFTPVDSNCLSNSDS
jgi:hypothetical protein